MLMISHIAVCQKFFFIAFGCSTTVRQIPNLNEHFYRVLDSTSYNSPFLRSKICTTTAQLPFEFQATKLTVNAPIMTTEGLKIIQASVEDVRTLQVIARETFFESFAAGTNADDMQTYLEDKFSIEQLQNELQHPESMFFIAWDQDKAIGYLKVNTGQAQTELRDETSLEIQRIYVKSDYHGKSVGQLLCAKALEIAHKHQKSYIWLGVWEKNPRAIRFYEKHGFFAFDAHVFEMGDDQQTDIMMKKILNEQAISI